MLEPHYPPPRGWKKPERTPYSHVRYPINIGPRTARSARSQDRDNWNEVWKLQLSRKGQAVQCAAADDDEKFGWSVLIDMSYQVCINGPLLMG